MKENNFISASGWFSLALPKDWVEYESEEEGTYAFFNSKSWTGNLRITPLRSSNSEDNMALSVSRSTLKEHQGAREMQLGELMAVSYKTYTKDAEQLVMYFWMAGKMNYVFTCSFTIDKAIDGSRKNNKELKLVEGIISSIRIL